MVAFHIFRVTRTVRKDGGLPHPGCNNDSYTVCAISGQTGQIDKNVTNPSLLREVPLDVLSSISWILPAIEAGAVGAQSKFWDVGRHQVLLDLVAHLRLALGTQWNGLVTRSLQQFARLDCTASFDVVNGTPGGRMTCHVLDQLTIWAPGGWLVSCRLCFGVCLVLCCFVLCLAFCCVASLGCVSRRLCCFSCPAVPLGSVFFGVPCLSSCLCSLGFLSGRVSCRVASFVLWPPCVSLLAKCFVNVILGVALTEPYTPMKMKMKMKMLQALGL